MLTTRRGNAGPMGGACPDVRGGAANGVLALGGPVLASRKQVTLRHREQRSRDLSRRSGTASTRRLARCWHTEELPVVHTGTRVGTPPGQNGEAGGIGRVRRKPRLPRVARAQLLMHVPDATKTEHNLPPGCFKQDSPFQAEETRKEYGLSSCVGSARDGVGSSSCSVGPGVLRGVDPVPFLLAG